MKSKIKPRVDVLDRDELLNDIPLRTPYVIYIDPCDKCNFQCKFCPTGNRDTLNKVHGRGHGLMDFDLYKKLIDEICQFEDKVKVIRLYKDGEPLLNPKFADMVRYAKASGCCEKVDTTTNASLLTHALSLNLINAGLDRLNISVEGINSEQYLNFSNYKIDFGLFVKNITFFYEHKNQCELNIKINGGNLTKEQEQDFFDTFGDITDGLSIEYPIDYWPTFSQNDIDIDKNIGLYGQKSEEVLVCPYIFYEMAINSDGTFSQCRFDWKRMLPLGGDLRLEITPKKIWNSIHLCNIQCSFLRGNRKARWFCAQCGELKQGLPVNLDNYREFLLDKL